MAAHKQASNNWAVENEIFHTVQAARFRVSKQHADAKAHTISGCSKLAEIEFTERHNNAISIVYGAMCAEYNLEHRKDCLAGKTRKEDRNDHTKILWNFLLQADTHLLHNPPDIMLMNYKKRTGLIIDITVPRNEKIQNKKLKKN